MHLGNLNNIDYGIDFIKTYIRDKKDDKYSALQEQEIYPFYVYFSDEKYKEIEDELTDEQKQQANIMLYASPTLSTAHFYKEDFLKILDCDNPESAQKAMSDWINSALDCGIQHIVKCAKTMINWLSGILNSFSVSITNGFTEGCNNKIKVLKRNAYGYQNFKRFRNRILHMYSHQHSNKIVKQAIA